MFSAAIFEMKLHEISMKHVTQRLHSAATLPIYTLRRSSVVKVEQVGKDWIWSLVLLYRILFHVCVESLENQVVDLVYALSMTYVHVYM